MVVGKESGTLWGLYHQALRELVDRYRAVSEQVQLIKLQQVDIEEGQHLIDNRADLSPFEKRRIAIRLEGLKQRHVLDVKSLEETSHTFYRFFQIATHLREAITEEYGEDLDEQTIYKLEEEHWTWKMREQAAQDMLQKGVLSGPTMSLLKARPYADEEGLELFAQVMTPEGRSSLLQWYQFEANSKARRLMAGLPDPPEKNLDLVKLEATLNDARTIFQLPSVVPTSEHPDRPQPSS